jgi:hypothetical protein
MNSAVFSTINVVLFSKRNLVAAKVFEPDCLALALRDGK